MRKESLVTNKIKCHTMNVYSIQLSMHINAHDHLRIVRNVFQDYITSTMNIRENILHKIVEESIP